MRVVLSPLLEKGIKRRTRAMPETVDIELEVDEEGRRILVAYMPDRRSFPIFAKLIQPQLASMGKRSFVMSGFELDRDTHQLFGQAWELEPAGRR